MNDYTSLTFTAVCASYRILSCPPIHPFHRCQEVDARGSLTDTCSAAVRQAAQRTEVLESKTKRGPARGCLPRAVRVCVAQTRRVSQYLYIPLRRRKCFRDPHRTNHRPHWDRPRRRPEPDWHGPTRDWSWSLKRSQGPPRPRRCCT